MHIMIDLETLGTAPTSVIIAIGAVAFDHNGLIDYFYKIPNTETQKSLGFTTDPSTLEWWQKQSDEAASILRLAENSAVSINKVLNDLTKFITQFATLDGVWGNGSDFDNVILANAYKTLGLPPAWSFRHNRCYRTLKTIGKEYMILDEPEPEGIPHNALDDAINQAKYAQKILKELTEWLR